jgi:hypothetical protein
MPKKKSVKLDKTEQYLLRNPQATVPQTIMACGVSRSTVVTARKNLRAQGLIEPAPWDFSSKEAQALTTESAAASIEEAEARAKEILNSELEPHQIRGELVALVNRARIADDDRTILAGIEAIRKHDASARDQTRLGPGPPLEEEGRIDRLSLLLEAVTPFITLKAALKAFTPDEIRDLAKKLQENAENGKKVDDAGIKESSVDILTSEGP